MTEKPVEEKLWCIFENVNQWLMYAERKNAVVLTFIGIQLTLLKLLLKDIDGWLLASLIALGLCFLTTLYSFFPRTKVGWWSKYRSKVTNKLSKKDNLLFYGDISKYSHDKYIEAMAEYLGENVQGYKSLEDLCVQIVENSKIASRKFGVFRVTFCLMIAGQILLLLSLWC